MVEVLMLAGCGENFYGSEERSGHFPSTWPLAVAIVENPSAFPPRSLWPPTY
jgi:hypothetical protein